MDEQTSLSELFDDLSDADIAEMTEADDTTETEAQSEDAKEVQDMPKDAPAETKMWKLKYMGEEKEYSETDVQALAQKGMDYDRIRQREEGLRTKLQELAGNTNIDEYLESLSQQQTEQQINNRVNELMNTGLYTEESAKEYAKLEQRLKTQESKQQAEQVQKDKQNQAQKEVGDFLLKNPTFAQKYPNGMPQEMVDAIEGGATLNEAWQAMQLKELQEQYEKLNQNYKELEQRQKNKESAAPAVKGDADAEDDPFLKALFST